MNQEKFDPSGLPAEHLDAATLEQLLALDDGELGLITEMYELFRDDTPPRLSLVESALAQDHPVELSEAAHAVKGAASTMGAPRVRALAAHLEAAGRKGGSIVCQADLLPLLRTEFEAAVQALDAFIVGKRG